MAASFVAARRRLLALLPLMLVPAGWLCEASPAFAGAPPLMLAEHYRTPVTLPAYWVSEKLDGVRAYWDGRQLLSRQGHAFAAPSWFTAGFPAEPLDGELWMGRGRFDALSGAVRRLGDAEAWREVRYMVFDLPSSSEVFDRRLARLQRLLASTSATHLEGVIQRKVASEAELMRWLDEVVAQGGEGLMLHHGEGRYVAARSASLLKLKRHDDAEAVVVAHLPGKGKYRGMLGALLVALPDGRRLRIGSGFSDAERREPPPVGSVVTYRYRGLTRTGLPRFATYWRVRQAP